MEYPKPYIKLRDRIIETLAIEEIVQDLTDHGTLRLPDEWIEQANGMKKWLLGLVEEQVTEEREERVAGRVGAVTKKQRKAAIHDPVAWSTACSEFEPKDNDENTCATCGWRKQNHDE